jgi:hypothetical protein
MRQTTGTSHEAGASKKHDDLWEHFTEQSTCSVLHALLAVKLADGPDAIKPVYRCLWLAKRCPNPPTSGLRVANQPAADVPAKIPYKRGTARLHAS